MLRFRGAGTAVVALLALSGSLTTAVPFDTDLNGFRLGDSISFNGLDSLMSEGALGRRIPAKFRIRLKREVPSSNQGQLMGQTTRGFGGGEAAAWMLENRLRGIADEEIKRQLFGGAPLYRMQNQLQPFTQRAKKAPLDEDVTMEMEPNPFIQVRPVREGRRYLLWRKITG